MRAKRLGDITTTQGIVLLIIGLAVMAYAYFGFETGVEVPADAGGGWVVNADLAQRQLLIFLAGSIATLLSGAFIAAGRILTAIEGDEA
jgi:ABC-type amino acid transport system permease subunit